jgi:hypothetical protein
MTVKSPPPPVNQTDTTDPGIPVVYKSDTKVTASLPVPTGSFKVVVASLAMFFLVGGVGVGVYLVGQKQQLQSQASNVNIPSNLTSVVKEESLNNETTPSANQTASQAGNTSQKLDTIEIPDLESSASGIELPDLEQLGSSSALSASSYDFNSDSVTNTIDLSVLYSAWGTPKNEAQKKADLNQDGVVNGIDYSMFVPNFNQAI